MEIILRSWVPYLFRWIWPVRLPSFRMLSCPTLRGPTLCWNSNMKTWNSHIRRIRICFTGHWRPSKQSSQAQKLLIATRSMPRAVRILSSPKYRIFSKNWKISSRPENTKPRNSWSVNRFERNKPCSTNKFWMSIKPKSWICVCQFRKSKDIFRCYSLQRSICATRTRQ